MYSVQCLALSLAFICYRFIVCGALGNIVRLAASQCNHRPPLLPREPPLGVECLAKWHPDSSFAEVELVELSRL